MCQVTLYKLAREHGAQVSGRALRAYRIACAFGAKRRLVPGRPVSLRTLTFSGRCTWSALTTLGSMKVAAILRMLHEDGWYLIATRGSHRQFKHPSRPGRVTVPGKPSDDLAPGTLGSILKQSGLRK